MNKASSALAIDHEKQQVSKLAGVGADRIRLSEIGWTSRVYLVDGGKFVGKFPRREEVKKEYAQEIKVYKLLEQLQSDIQVPKLRWTDPDNNYIGYEGIQGVEFDTVAQDLKPELQRQIGSSIGQFLRDLHSRHLGSPHIMSVDDEIKQFQEKYAGSLSVIADSFSEGERAAIEKFIHHDLPPEMRRLGSNAVLCHGDLGYWNIILKDDGKIGLIDFGDVGYYDQSKDLCGLEDDLVFNAALEVYGDSNRLREKIAIRRKAIPFLHLQYFGRHDNKEMIAETVNRIRAELGLGGGQPQ